MFFLKKHCFCTSTSCTENTPLSFLSIQIIIFTTLVSEKNSICFMAMNHPPFTHTHIFIQAFYRMLQIILFAQVTFYKYKIFKPSGSSGESIFKKLDLF